jgi:hypothetical protein
MLTHRGEDSATEDARMRDDFVEHLRHVKFMLGYRRHFDVLYVGYRNVLEHPAQEARRINEFLGDTLDERAMAEVADRGLYRNRA